MSMEDNRAPDEIEGDIEQTRSEMRETLDAIQSKLTPGQMMDEVMSYFRGGPGEFASNLGRVVRDNPVPVMLVGVGLAWLAIASTRRRDAHDYERGYYDEDEERYYYASAGGGDYIPSEATDYTSTGGIHHPTSSSAGVYTSGSDATSPAVGTVSPVGSTRTAGSTNGGSPDDSARRAGWTDGGSSSDRAGYGAGASGTRQDQEKGGYGGTEGRPSYGGPSYGSESYGSSSYGSGSYGGSSQGSGQDYRQGRFGRGQISRFGGMARDQGRRMRSGLSEMTEQQPLLMAAAAFALGAALGALMPSTRRESRLMGETRDEWKDRAVEMGREGLHRAERVVQETWTAVSDEVLNPNRETGESDEKAEHVAERMSETSSTKQSSAESSTTSAAGRSNVKPGGAAGSTPDATSSRKGSETKQS